MPAGQRRPPLVFIVPGSGPIDRDGNNAAGLSTDCYRLLAAGLAAQGIASLRIDKRGLKGSAAAIADGNAVTVADYGDDLQAWASVLRREVAADGLWLLGHSEGGLVALAATGRLPDLRGVALVAAFGRRFGDVLREQLSNALRAGPLLAEALAAIDTLEQGGGVDAASLSPELLTPFHPAVQGFLRDVMSYDPPALLADYTGPVLVLQGGCDLQVTEADARKLAAASAHAELILLPEMNHVLKAVATDDRQANLAAYADPSLPLAPGVVESIARFVTGAVTSGA